MESVTWYVACPARGYSLRRFPVSRFCPECGDAIDPTDIDVAAWSVHWTDYPDLTRLEMPGYGISLLVFVASIMAMESLGLVSVSFLMPPVLLVAVIGLTLFWQSSVKRTPRLGVWVRTKLVVASATVGLGVLGVLIMLFVAPYLIATGSFWARCFALWGSAMAVLLLTAGRSMQHLAAAGYRRKILEP